MVLAFDIPKKRAFMHLDTVFTMVDYDKFTIHPEIEGPLTVYSLRKGEEPEDLIIEKETMKTLPTIGRPSSSSSNFKEILSFLG